MVSPGGQASSDAIDQSSSFEQEALSINLRRTQLVGVVAFADLTVQAMLGWMRGDQSLVAMAASGAALSLAFAAAAYVANSASSAPIVRKYIPIGLMITLLLIAQMLAVLGSHERDLVNGYCIVLIGVAALFKLPPRNFIILALMTWAAMLAWIAGSEMRAVAAWQNAGTSAFALVAAVMIRNLLYEARQRDHRLRTIIAEQNRALSKANLELAQRNHEVRETMAIAAHDLRSPLAALHSLFTYAAPNPAITPDRMRTILTEARQSVGTMLDLVGKLIQAHEGDHRHPVEPQTFELHALVLAAIERVRIAAVAMDVDVEHSGNDALILLHTDRDAVARILDNLLSNAIRYSVPGGVVHVTCHADAAAAKIEVLDEGIGIPPADQSRIFDKFQRGSPLPVGGGAGAGLGLYIAREAAASIAARLDYVPRHHGGSIFRLTIPLDRDPGL